MAATTFTASDQNAQPRQLADGGPVTVRFSYITGATATTLSTSDVIFLAKIPEGATIIDGYICGKIPSGTGTVVKVGILPGTATDDDFIASVTLSATTVLKRFDGLAGLPYALPAIAATTYPKYTWLSLTEVSGTVTASVSIQGSITYLTGGL